MLTYRRVFKVGDRVKIADFVGDVVNTRFQVTHLRTIKNEEIVVPNSMIVNSHVINYSSLAGERGLILHTTVSIGYDAPWRQVKGMLLTAAERTAPVLVVQSFDDLARRSAEARGKIVLFNVPFTNYGETVRYRGVGAVAAARAGAVASLIEWDEDIPDWETLEAESLRARAAQCEALAARDGAA